MSGVVNESMGIALGCELAQVAPWSGIAGSRVGDGSLRNGRPFVALGSSGFTAVYRRGKRAGDEGLVVICASGDSGPAQVGIVAGRGVGNAVCRNRAKRRLREALAVVGLRPSTAYVVIASPEVVAMPFDRLVSRLGEAVAGTEE
ncbi:MAG: hypothetical protein BMS9Abin07_1049 [Acidimicrobiia bacterium]|nr:MAG: hypothetical protein BMS9Abin07_1049 [Acidimicrobiia bacterium]